jgi:hypothetical protein
MRDLLGVALLAILIGAIVSFIVVGFLRRSRTFVLVSFVIAASLALLYYEFPPDFHESWEFAIRYGLLVALGALLWVAINQEPAWLARRLGFTRQSPEWEYDVTLSGLRRAFYEKVRAAAEIGRVALERDEPPPANEIEELRSDAARILATLRSTSAPTPGWAALAAECVALFELSLDHFGVPIDDAVERQIQAGHARTSELREKLVAEYRFKARSQFRWP